jgi:hypothetical protein
VQNVLEIIQQSHSVRTPFDPERQIAERDVRQIPEAVRRALTAPCDASTAFVHCLGNHSCPQEKEVT